ncbi:hypothetical protein SNK03_001418 [Fusarium graminearum]|nr:unnamed protein product [Fusarium graminearum]CAG1963541.1 unnamed protein product [Fusarium graminearum]VTO84941.1 unnamed protein product [Fusarium graminearum]
MELKQRRAAARQVVRQGWTYILKAEEAIGAVISEGTSVLEHFLERREVEDRLLFLLCDSILLAGCSGCGLEAEARGILSVMRTILGAT